MTTNDGLDDLLLRLGIGKWNYLFFATALFVTALLPIYLIGSEFLNPEPVFTCDIPDNNYTKPFNGSQCLMIEITDTGEQNVSCTKWKYNRTIFHSTVSMEWDLVCDRAWLSPLFQTIYTAGCFLGAIFAGVAGNRYGRRWSVRVGVILTIAATIVMIVSPWFQLVFIARFLLGVFNTIMVCPAFMLTMEACIPSLRSTVGIMLALPYALMMVGLASMAYLIRDWRTLQAAASTPCLFLVPIVFLVDESPRWLLVTGRLQDAVNVIQRGARLNKVNLSGLDVATLISTVHQKQTSVSSITTTSKATSVESNRLGNANFVACMKCGRVYAEGEHGRAEEGRCRHCQSSVSLGLEDGYGAWWAGPIALVRTNIMRRLTLVLVVVWLLQGIVYLALPLSSDAFSSPFLYMALLGLVEIPAYTLTAPITKKLGRKMVVVFCLVSSGTFLLSMPLIDELGLNDESTHLILVLLSYLMVCSAYQVNFLYAPELFPTTLRPWGSSVCTLSAFVGYSIPPFITDYLADGMEWLPVVIFGCSGVVAGLLVLLLPETNGRTLPDTVADLRERLEEEILQKKSQTKRKDLAQTIAIDDKSRVSVSTNYTNTQSIDDVSKGHDNKHYVN